MSKKILVTGGSGFVGRFLIERLILNQKNSIIALYNENSIPEVFKGLPNLEWRKADITRDDLQDLLSGINIVYHLAGYSSTSDDSQEIKKLNDINVTGTSRLAEACINSKVIHFIFVSSIAACENSSEPLIHELNGHPISSYGKTKKQAEEILFQKAKGSFAVTILRPTALFGEMHKGSVYELTKKIHDKQFVIFGSGNGITNFFYIRDFIDLLSSVELNNDAYGEIFIAADKPLRLNLVVSLVIDALNSKFKVIKVPLWAGYIFAKFFDFLALVFNRQLPFSLKRFSAMTKETTYSNAKAIRSLGIKYNYGVRHGLKKTISWYQEEGML